MMNFIWKRMNKKGFTLIELIVVIAILGILAVIAIPRFTGMREDANEGAVIANLRTIQTGAEVVAAREDILITAVTEDQISEVLGITDFTDLDDSPKDATYSFTNGLATLDTEPSVYPDDGVQDFSDIGSN